MGKGLISLSLCGKVNQIMLFLGRIEAKTVFLNKLSWKVSKKNKSSSLCNKIIIVDLQPNFLLCAENRIVMFNLVKKLVWIH